MNSIRVLACLALFVSFLSFSTSSTKISVLDDGGYSRVVRSVSDIAVNLSEILLPAGFKIDIAASQLQSARTMAFSPDNTVLFVGSYSYYLYALIDNNNDGEFESTLVLSNTLSKPTGLEVTSNGNYLVVATPSTIMIYNLTEVMIWINETNTSENNNNNSNRGFLNLNPKYLLTNPFPNPITVVKFSMGSQIHFLRAGSIINNDNDNLYLTFPSIVNTNFTIPSPYATILRLNITAVVLGIQNSTIPQVVAIGVRDSQGMDFSPLSGNLWFTDNGCEYLGESNPLEIHCNFPDNNNNPPDELNQMNFTQISQSQTLDYGFPLCVGDNVPDPTYPNYDTNCVKGKVSAYANLSAHEAPLGLVFYPEFPTTQKCSFPPMYYNTMFFTTHGSTFRQPIDGHTIQWGQTVMQNGVEVLDQLSVFAKGWLQTFPNGTQAFFGRPDSVIVNPNDGSLLIADDYFMGVWRICYTGNQQTETEE
eukprot:TRINITY_DN1358_c0_g1_i1.p1 TRINITY_DN1358_c0_g1~~TRINITY_DN1358_c0_g1_i1.p1  ORF type:complete len:477 (+),score=94.87 TRINITY_DN1358_c0_g1_i1:78-1508(+)